MSEHDSDSDSDTAKSHFYPRGNSARTVGLGKPITPVHSKKGVTGVLSGTKKGTAVSLDRSRTRVGTDHSVPNPKNSRHTHAKRGRSSPVRGRGRGRSSSTKPVGKPRARKKNVSKKDSSKDRGHGKELSKSKSLPMKGNVKNTNIQDRMLLNAGLKPLSDLKGH